MRAHPAVMACPGMITDTRRMMKRILAARTVVIALAAGLAGLLAMAGPATADTLTAPADAPWIAHVATDALLALHIGGGGAGIVLGALAFMAPKGSRLHRRIGLAFVAAMGLCYAIGAATAPFLETGQRVNATAGCLALYLLLSGWGTARRRAFVAGAGEAAGLVTALAVVGLGGAFMALASRTAEGTIDGSPPQAFILFTVVGSLAALGEAHALLRRRLDGAHRIARHLWRMGMSLFIAAGSFFFGQEQVLPGWLRGGPLQLALGFAPLVLTVAWLAWTLRPRRRPQASTVSG